MKDMEMTENDDLPASTQETTLESLECITDVRQRETLADDLRTHGWTVTMTEAGPVRLRLPNGWVLLPLPGGATYILLDEYDRQRGTYVDGTLNLFRRFEIEAYQAESIETPERDKALRWCLVVRDELQENVSLHETRCFGGIIFSTSAYNHRDDQEDRRWASGNVSGGYKSVIPTTSALLPIGIE